MTPVLVDTGFLVALFDPSDRAAASAASYLRDHHHPLATVGWTIVESGFFLSPQRKVHLLSWIRRGGVSIVHLPVTDYPTIERTVSRYADRDIDLVDAALVWLANETGARRILTVDRSDFEVYRLKDSRRFDLIDWYRG